MAGQSTTAPGTAARRVADRNMPRVAAARGRRLSDLLAPKADDRPTPKSAATRQRILDAAAKVFREYGYAGARLADIAVAAGTKAGSLYYHFESREALVEEVLDEGLDRAFGATRQAVAALRPNASTQDRLATAIRTHVTTALEIDNYTSATIRMLGHVPAPIRARHLRRQAVYGAWWRALLAEAAADGTLRPGLDLPAARMLLLGMLNWTPEWYHPGRLTPAEIADQAVMIALNGLLAPNSGTDSGQVLP